MIFSEIVMAQKNYVTDPSSCFSPVHGLIFLFKWKAGEKEDGSLVQDDRLDEIFFAKQVKMMLHFTNFEHFYN